MRISKVNIYPKAFSSLHPSHVSLLFIPDVFADFGGLPQRPTDDDYKEALIYYLLIPPFALEMEFIDIDASLRAGLNARRQSRIPRRGMKGKARQSNVHLIICL